MFRKTFFFMTLASFTVCGPLQAQTPPKPTGTNQKYEDDQVPNRFWQASVGGGHYMVALERISAISRHKYLLDGGILVDEVTVDAMGQGLVRFYFLSPLTDSMKGTGTGAAAARIVDRGRELVERASDITGSNAQNMVIKKFPETTHAREIEFRVESAAELSALYSSVRTAWENGRGRKFAIK